MFDWQVNYVVNMVSSFDIMLIQNSVNQTCCLEMLFILKNCFFHLLVLTLLKLVNESFHVLSNVSKIFTIL